MAVSQHLIAQRWQQMKHTYGWNLIDDATLIAAAEAEIEVESGADTSVAERITVGIYRVYNRYLYQSILHLTHDIADSAAIERANQACLEIQLTVRRCVLAKAYSADLADEIAQQIVLRLLSEPHVVRQPQSLLAWVMWQTRALLKAAQPASTEAVPLKEDNAGDVRTAPNLEQSVETRLRDMDLDALLIQTLSPFHRQLIIMTEIEERPPREIAQLLKVKVTQIYVEKGRALKKLRENPACQRFFERLPPEDGQRK
jgi:RNA polymerase sigma factor (sigma-70 family)